MSENADEYMAGTAAGVRVHSIRMAWSYVGRNRFPKFLPGASHVCLSFAINSSSLESPACQHQLGTPSTKTQSVACDNNFQGREEAGHMWTVAAMASPLGRSFNGLGVMNM